MHTTHTTHTLHTLHTPGYLQAVLMQPGIFAACLFLLLLTLFSLAAHLLRVKNTKPNQDRNDMKLSAERFSRLGITGAEKPNK